jgi:ectoine hydroxylase-related dioxygenase (phytanoyl-CoA dioxygenase family)
MTVFANFQMSSLRDAARAAESQARVLSAIRDLKLESNAWELDARGYTVLTPAQVADGGLSHGLLDRIVALAREREGMSVDVSQGLEDGARTMLFGRGLLLDRMLFEGICFEQALLHAPALALIRYLLGESCVLSHMSAMLKGAGDEYLELHTDQVGTPSPLPPYAQTANATWVLSDYSAQNGSTCFVDGSHRYGRHPTVEEATDLGRFHPIDAAAGSIIVWGGNMWHGAVPRRAPGLRASLMLYFCRFYITQSDHRLRDDVTPAMLARNPQAFADIVGLAGRQPDDNDLSNASFAAVSPATSHGATTMCQFA